MKLRRAKEIARSITREQFAGMKAEAPSPVVFEAFRVLESWVFKRTVRRYSDKLRFLRHQVSRFSYYSDGSFDADELLSSLAAKQGE